MFLEWENNSGKFQNNAINDVKQISRSHVIKHWIKKIRILHLIWKSSQWSYLGSLFLIFILVFSITMELLLYNFSKCDGDYI